MAHENDFFSPGGRAAARDWTLKQSGQEGPSSEAAKQRRGSSMPVPGWMKKKMRLEARERERLKKAADKKTRKKKKPTLAELLKSRSETSFQREKRRVIQRETSPAARRRIEEQQDRAFSP